MHSTLMRTSIRTTFVTTALLASVAIADQQPVLADQQPALADQQPALADQQPALADQQPALANQQPANQQPSPATQPSKVALQSRIDSLEQRIATLQQAQSANQAEISQAIAQVLDDADRHSLMMSSKELGASGYDPDRGFELASNDGNFLIHPGLLMQFRNETSFREHIPTGGGGVAGGTGYDNQNGFEVSRLRFTLDGNAFSPMISYFVQFQADQGTPFSLLDAYVMYRVSSQSPLAMKVGQFKDPLFHERNTLPGNQLAVDRSVQDALLGGGQTERVQGGEMIYDENRLRGVVAYHDGYNTGNTDFYDSGGRGADVGDTGGLSPPNWGSSVRAEYLLIGDRTPQFNPFSEYDQFTAMNARQDILVVGGGAEYTESGDNKLILHTVDAQLVTANGWGLYSSFIGSYRNLPTFKGVRRGSYYDSGALIQASYIFDQRYEPFLRYDYTHLNGAAAEPGIIKDNIHEITLGGNYYMRGQNAKITVDFSWLPNGCPTDLTDLGILEDDGKNEFILRAQFQLEI